MVMTDALGTAGLQRGLLSDQIYAMIKAMIKESTLAPGEHSSSPSSRDSSR